MLSLLEIAEFDTRNTTKLRSSSLGLSFGTQDALMLKSVP